MNTEFMMVNPNELVIDMPVDEANVKQKMESLQANGVIQPVTVWLQGMRIIDGFHRTVAAVRLGWSEIPCNVVDCTEDAFWDARIQSAKQHYEISSQRLASWIVESWKLSSWYQPVDIERVKDEYKKFGKQIPNINDEVFLEKFSAAQAVWSTDFESKPESVISSWFSDKAAKWGINKYEIKQKFLDCLGYWNVRVDSIARAGSSPKLSAIGEVLKVNKVTLAEADAISDQVPHIHWRDLSETVESVSQWVADTKSGKIDTPLLQYREKQRLDDMAKLREKQSLDMERQRQHRESPAGQAELAKLRVDSIREEIEVMEYRLGKIDNYLAKTPEAATMLTEFVLLIESKVKAAFPEYALKSQTNPLLAANAELRKKVREQDERIASLERALKSKGNVSRNVVAMASEELERIN